MGLQWNVDWRTSYFGINSFIQCLHMSWAAGVWHCLVQRIQHWRKRTKLLPSWSLLLLCDDQEASSVGIYAFLKSTQKKGEQLAKFERKMWSQLLSCPIFLLSFSSLFAYRVTLASSFLGQVSLENSKNSLLWTVLEILAQSGCLLQRFVPG